MILEEKLLKDYSLSVERMLQIKSDFYCVEAYDFKNYILTNIDIDNEAKSFCIDNLIVPIALECNVLTIVMDNPFRLDLIETLRLLTSCDIKCRVGLGRDVEKYIANISQIFRNSIKENARLCVSIHYC